MVDALAAEAILPLSNVNQFSAKKASWWTPSRNEFFLQLWKEKKSYGLIAQIMGCSRNMIAGKAKRSGLKFKSTSFKKRNRIMRRVSVLRKFELHQIQRRTFAMPEIEPLQDRLEDLFMELKKSCSLSDLTGNTCRWPQGDPQKPDFNFCGEYCSGSDGPYCAEHRAIAYQPNLKRRVR